MIIKSHCWRTERRACSAGAPSASCFRFSYTNSFRAQKAIPEAGNGSASASGCGAAGGAGGSQSRAAASRCFHRWPGAAAGRRLPGEGELGKLRRGGASFRRTFSSSSWAGAPLPTRVTRPTSGPYQNRVRGVTSQPLRQGRRRKQFAVGVKNIRTYHHHADRLPADRMRARALFDRCAAVLGGLLLRTLLGSPELCGHEPEHVAVSVPHGDALTDAHELTRRASSMRRDEFRICQRALADCSSL